MIVYFRISHTYRVVLELDDWIRRRVRLVQRALNNQWLAAQGVPELRTIWIKLHYGAGSVPDPKV